MIDRGVNGSIIRMSSITSQQKGLNALTRLTAVEWSRDRIRVNAIGPTHIRTPLIDEKMREEPVVAEYFRNIIPLGRPGEPEDVVGAAIYLAPAASSVVTGHVVFVEGGHTVR